MAHKYGIYQSTFTSCIFYKQDEDGNQSTFNIFISPETEGEEQKKIHAFIDNEQLRTENWFGRKDLDVNEILEAFGGWASDAPFVFEMDAHKSITQCLSSTLKKEETD